MGIARKTAGTTPDEILTLAVARLIEQIDGLTPATCVVVDNPDDAPPTTPRSPFCYTVAFAPTGKFDESAFDGGATMMATVDAVLVVTVHRIASNDKAGSAESFLLDRNNGIFAAGMRPVLKALAGHDLLDKDGNGILAQPLFPVDWDVHRESARRGSIQVGFRAIFDYDLTT